jgi:hypothetical protein
MKARKGMLNIITKEIIPRSILTGTAISTFCPNTRSMVVQPL